MQAVVVASVVVPPDPILTANLYCDARLDELIGQVIVPFQRELATRHGDSWHFWMVRYARRGEHLKVRLHGPAGDREQVKSLLAGLAAPFFATLEAPDPHTPRRVAMKSPPIDLDDQAEGLLPDRSLLWTEYRRSHVSLAGEPFLLDDRYVSLFVRCLTVGCARSLGALRTQDLAIALPGKRPGILLTLLTDGLSSAVPQAAQQASYLAYHRDWLIRFTLLKRQTEPERMMEVVAQFDRRLESMVSRLDALRERLQRREGLRQPAEPSWPHALGELLQYSRALCASADYHIDPFASDPAFVCLFKVLHGVSNQLGLSMLDEAFVYHMLLRATELTREPLATARAVEMGS